MVGAAVAVVSSTAESWPCGETLPAASVRVAVTVRVAPSAGLATVVVQVPAVMSAAVSTWDCGVVPSVKVRVSPALAPAGTPTATAMVVAAPNSAALM